MKEMKDKKKLKMLIGLVVLYFVENDLALECIENDELWMKHNKQRKEIRSKIEEIIKSV